MSYLPNTSSSHLSFPLHTLVYHVLHSSSRGLHSNILRHFSLTASLITPPYIQCPHFRPISGPPSTPKTTRRYYRLIPIRAHHPQRVTSNFPSTISGAPPRNPKRNPRKKHTASTAETATSATDGTSSLSPSPPSSNNNLAKLRSLGRQYQTRWLPEWA